MATVDETATRSTTLNSGDEKFQGSISTELSKNIHDQEHIQTEGTHIEHLQKPDQIEGQAKMESRESPTTVLSAPLHAEPQMINKPIIFVDPLGARWELPFNAVKTWKETHLLVTNILEVTLKNSWYSRRFQDWEGEAADGRISVLKLPDRTIINPDTWAQTIEPGLQFELLFAGEPNLVQGILDKHNEHKSKTQVMPREIGYVARLYQQDGSSYPDYLRQMTYSEPLTNNIQPIAPTSATVLAEIRNVYLNLAKRAESHVADYGSIHRDDIMGALMLQIESEVLFDALKAILRFHIAVEYTKDAGFDVPRNRFLATRFRHYTFPFADLYWHIDELKSYCTSGSSQRENHSQDYNATCDHHIGVLLSYLYEQPAIGYAKAEQRWSKPIPTCDFDTLWILLKPGSDVYVRERDQLNAYVVERVEGMPMSPTERPKSFEVKVWNIDYDGERLGRSFKTILVPAFDDEREITSLPIFPTRFHTDKGKKPLREELIERGKRFVRVVTQPTYQEFTGSSNCYIGRKYTQARVIVDHSTRPWTELLDLGVPPHIPTVDHDDKKSLSWRTPRCECAACIKDGAVEGLQKKPVLTNEESISFDHPTQLTEHQYFVCFSHVYIFALQDRCWDFVDVRGLTEANINSRVIDTLVLKPKSNKDVVKAICETYTQTEDNESLFFADNIRGKGEGQIILLHGPPGTGKTLTAESIAEFVGRPLLSITGADLGHEPVVLEKNLLKFFRNASKWDAIVLLDEADVYLERRSVNDLQRNSIVTVFLRALDYFQGILFLTTNRVGAFDEAFMSRIHIQIGYDPLDDDSRKQIWTNNFKKLGEHERNGRRIEYAWSAKEFVTQSPALKALEWNGREIRNAFQTAVALACYEAKQRNEKVPKVTEDHFSQIVDMSTNFKKYMKAALQHDDAELAFLNGLRADKFIQLLNGGKS